MPLRFNEKFKFIYIKKTNFEKINFLKNLNFITFEMMYFKKKIKKKLVSLCAFKKRYLF